MEYYILEKEEIYLLHIFSLFFSFKKFKVRNFDYSFDYTRILFNIIWNQTSRHVM